ncbi:MAG: hypothetical protein NC203_12470, partial [Firmicutes bacterium]|nr:hypothetical protein [Bacillota bacterium]
MSFRRLKKKMLAFMLPAAALLTAVIAVPSVPFGHIDAQEGHFHTLCEGTACTDPTHTSGHGDNFEWQLWESDNSLPTTAGKYVLAN